MVEAAKKLEDTDFIPEEEGTVVNNYQDYE